MWGRDRGPPDAAERVPRIQAEAGELRVVLRQLPEPPRLEGGRQRSEPVGAFPSLAKRRLAPFFFPFLEGIMVADSFGAFGASWRAPSPCYRRLAALFGVEDIVGVFKEVKIFKRNSWGDGLALHPRVLF